jgi:hypothetical protein
MICEVCEGEGYVRGKDPANPGALVMLPCLECGGSGIASCCDAAGAPYVWAYDDGPNALWWCGKGSGYTGAIVVKKSNMGSEESE